MIERESTSIGRTPNITPRSPRALNSIRKNLRRMLRVLVPLAISSIPVFAELGARIKLDSDIEAGRAYNPAVPRPKEVSPYVPHQTREYALNVMHSDVHELNPLLVTGGEVRKNALTILGIGDSVMKFFLDESSKVYTSLTREMLEHELCISVNFLNTAVIGYDARIERIVLEEWLNGEALHDINRRRAEVGQPPLSQDDFPPIDLEITGHCLNDQQIVNLDTSRGFYYGTGLISRDKRMENENWFSRHSELLTQYVLWRDLQNAKSSTSFLEAIQGDSIDPTYVAQEKDMFEERLKMKQLLDAANIPGLTLVTPYRDQDTDEKLGPQNRFAEFCQERGIALCDFTKDFQRLIQSMNEAGIEVEEVFRKLFRDENHLAEKGHKFVAGLLTLRIMRLIKEDPRLSGKVLRLQEVRARELLADVEKARDTVYVTWSSADLRVMTESVGTVSRLAETCRVFSETVQQRAIQEPTPENVSAAEVAVHTLAEVQNAQRDALALLAIARAKAEREAKKKKENVAAAKG